MIRGLFAASVVALLLIVAAFRDAEGCRPLLRSALAAFRRWAARGRRRDW